MFLSQLVDSAPNLIDIINTFISEIEFIISISLKLLTQIPDYFSWLPFSVYFNLYLTLSVAIFYLLIGRQ